MTGVQVDNLTKRWQGTTAVQDVSFSTTANEFVALLGPSGCGKSTTLRLVAGLEIATSGTIRIGGRDVTNFEPSKRNLSMVFQSYALFPHLTVAGNILFGLSVRGVPKAEQHERLTRVVNLLGLGALLDRRPAALSGGQQQRVALGRALIAETKVCLLDEPLSNLDAQLRAEMRNEIRALQQRLGIAMLYVTHDQTEAMSMADRIILMRAGRIEQSGSPSELYERPTSTFAARFIGTPPMNVVDLVDSSAGRIVAGSDGPAVLPSGARPLQLGLRPEAIVFSNSGQPATVETVEYFGADTITTCRAGSQKVVVSTPGRPGFRAGAAVHLAWNPSSQHLFDADTGRHCEAA